MSRPTYRRHPMDKRRPAPHLAPRSPKRLRRDQRMTFNVLMETQERQIVVGTTRVRRHGPGIALSLPRHSEVHALAAAAALGPDPRQENRS